jgi:hypothetical protein
MQYRMKTDHSRTVSVPDKRPARIVIPTPNGVATYNIKKFLKLFEPVPNDPSNRLDKLERRVTALENQRHPPPIL